ncbi:MAG: hypothetical protein EOP00_17020 [Pedobacter sp.]|nr:MAG: hypothetical protein EOP00_17020 [Pedobacter sp.]
MRINHFLFFLFFSIQLLAQDFTLKEIPVRDADNTYLICSAPFVDKDGFVWYSINTEGVFYRFDGKNKIEYNFFGAEKKNIMVGDPLIVNWFQDSNGIIWAINLKGAFLINPKTFSVRFIKWEPWKNVGYHRDYRSVTIKEDKLNNIWIAIGDYYILKFDANYKPIKIIDNRVNPSMGFMRIIKLLDNGKVLVKTDKNLIVIDEKEKKVFKNSDYYGINTFSNFVENGKIFQKNGSGIYYLNDTPYPYKYIKEFDIQVFDYPYENFVHLDSKLISSGTYKKVYISEILDPTHIRTTDSLTLKTRINNVSFDKDKNGIVWFSTAEKIYMLKTKSTKFKKHLQFDYQVSTRSMFSDAKDNLYVGSYSGLWKIDTKGKPQRTFSPENEYHYYNSMVLENDSILWSFDDGSSLSRMNLKTGKRKFFSSNPREDFQTIFLKKKAVDSFWIGSNKGLFVFDKKTANITRIKQQLLNNLMLYDLIQTKDGSVWVATEKGLFVKVKGKPFINYKKLNPSFVYNNLLYLHEDKHQNLWIGTSNNGVLVVNIRSGKIINYDQSSGLSSNTVCGVLESKNALWFSTFYGLSAFNKKTRQFNNFYEEDGISNNEFNLRSLYKKNDTTFYFGGLDGITEFNPEKVGTEKKGYKIFLSSCEYYSKKNEQLVKDYLHLKNKVITLPYNKNFFSADFAINDIFYYDKNTYYYKLEGLSDEWVNIGASGTVKLYGLPAGDYILYVKGKDFEGFETINQIKIHIRIEQIFYRTPVFIVFLRLLTFSFIIHYYRKKAHKQKKIFLREKEITELKSNALKAQMNPHFVFNILNNIQSIMMLKGELEVNKYFVAFSRLMRLTLDISKQEFVSLKDEIDYLRNYILLHNLQLNDELIYTITIDESIKDTESLYIQGMFVQPFVENAILHGLSPKKDDKRIDINYSTQNGYIIVAIEDNGIGREASAFINKNRNHNYKSWSTIIVNERIKIINAIDKESILISIEDLKQGENAVGTRVILKFKIKESPQKNDSKFSEFEN